MTALLILSGAACVAWGLILLPVLAEHYSVQRIAPRVISGQGFDAALLESAVLKGSRSSDVCHPPALNAVAIIRLRQYETVNAGAERKLTSEAINTLRESVHAALSCSPTLPFLWFLKYWLEVVENGFSAKALEYLRMSYKLGPNEGWISALRNRFSLAVYDQLPEDLAARVVPEFVSLVRSGFYAQAASNLSGPGWQKREVLLAALAPLTERRRYEFAKHLRAGGIYVDIPGLISPPRRPWN